VRYKQEAEVWRDDKDIEVRDSGKERRYIPESALGEPGVVGTELVLLPPLLTMVLAGEGPVETEPETAMMGAIGVPVGDMAANGVLNEGSSSWMLCRERSSRDA
jgi:hypothetical protein